MQPILIPISKIPADQKTAWEKCKPLLIKALLILGSAATVEGLNYLSIWISGWGGESPESVGSC